MLLRFSVVTVGGNEIIEYESPAYETNPLGMNKDLFAGFLEALQMLSEEMGNPLRQIHLSSSMLYIKTYGDFSIRLLVDEKMDERVVEDVFKKIARQTLKSLSKVLPGEVIKKKIVEKKFLPLLDDLLERGVKQAGPRIDVQETLLGRVTLVGLAEAGKTTIKRLFFEKWACEEARKTKPTLGVAISQEKLDFLAERFQVFDVGGQTRFRKQNLTQSDLWKNLTALIFVIDLQAPDLFPEAKEYLDAIWKIVEKNHPKKRPTLSILLHKFDVEDREKLGENLWKAFLAFEDVADFASFHTTTMFDTSAIEALIKILYFSLPDIVIKKLLEEGFLERVSNDLIPQLAILLPLKEVEEISGDLLAEIWESAVIFGKTYGLSLQRSWLDSLLGEYCPQPRELRNELLSVTRKGPTLMIRIPVDPSKYPHEFTKTLLDGVLTGITKTFFLINPKIVDEDQNSITWQVGIENPL